MKILEVNLERGWRGGERQTLWSAIYFREQGHDVVLAARAGEALADAARKEGLAVQALGGSGQLMRFLATAGRRFDILHAQTAHTLTACVLTRGLHRRPVVCTRRVAFELGGRFTRYKYRCADRVVAISQAAAVNLRETGIDSIEIIPSAIRCAPADSDRARRFVEQYGLQGKKVLATMAALTPDKDPATLVEAVRHASLQRDDFIFVHFGSGAMQAETAQRIAAAGLGERYILAGFHPDPEAFYTIMHGFVLSSREEGLGSSVMDAMAQRVPVAATAAGGLQELLADGRGLLSPVGDAAALGNHMLRLLSDDDGETSGRLERTERAYRWVMQECSLERVGERYLQLFRTLAEPGGQR